MATQEEQDAMNARVCLENAVKTGFFTGAQAAVVSGLLYKVAMKYSYFFRHHFNASARTALTVMPIFYTGYLNAELTMHKCMFKQRPQHLYGYEDEDEA